MNYTEKYELREIHGRAYTILDRYETEPEAMEAMKSESRYTSGNWRVVRIMEITVASVIKA